MAMGINYYDVIIAGAGPAGISTALFLEEMVPGISGSVLILEKEVFPREKPCAGAITPKGLKILDAFSLIPAGNCKKINSVTFTYGDHKLTLPQKKHSLIVKRSHFDAWFADCASKKGFKINFGERFLKVERIGEKLHIKTGNGEYACRILVGADGAKSSVRKSFISPERYISPLLISKCKSEASSDDRQDSLVFDFTCLEYGTAGYVWNFPASENGERHTGIFIWMGKEGTKISLHSLLLNYQKKNGITPKEKKFSGFIEKLYDPSSPISCGPVLLTGEAAGIDALMGEGIAESLQYGSFTAGEIKKALAKGDFSFKSYSANFKKSSLGKELSQCFKYSKHFYEGNFRFWLSLLFNNQRFRDFLLNDFSGYGNLRKHSISLAAIVAEHKLKGNSDISGNMS